MTIVGLILMAAALVGLARFANRPDKEPPAIKPAEPDCAPEYRDAADPWPVPTEILIRARMKALTAVTSMTAADLDQRMKLISGGISERHADEIVLRNRAVA